MSRTHSARPARAVRAPLTWRITARTNAGQLIHTTVTNYPLKRDAIAAGEIVISDELRGEPFTIIDCKPTHIDTRIRNRECSF